MKLLALFIVLAMASGAVAQPIPDYNLSSFFIDHAAVGASVTVAPDGGGAPFTEAYAPGGGIVDATITVQLLYSDGSPAIDYPGSDLWLETTGGGLARCSGWGTFADGSTDDQGMTTWQQPKYAGGCSVGEHVLVMLVGAPIAGTLDLVFRSPDLNGDLDVDLTDIVAFAQALLSQETCADFTNDGAVNLSDIVIMAQGIGAECEPAE